MNSPIRFPYLQPTMVLIGINVVMFVVSAVVDGSVLSISPQTLDALGGNSAVLSLTGDTWRLLTATFLHGGVVHLLMNMYMLLLIGRIAERQYGRAGMCCIYLLGGIAASYASAWWSGSHVYRHIPFEFAPLLGRGPVVNIVVSIGASGALMALCSAMLVAGAFAFDPTPGRDSSSNEGWTQGLLQVIGLSLASGFMTPGVDQAAHIGGLIAGSFLGMAIGWSFGGMKSQWATVGLTTILTACVLASALHFGSLPELGDLRARRGRELVEKAQKEKKDEDERKLEADRAEAARVAEKKRADSAQKLLAQLPPPVSEKAARGRVLRFQRRVGGHAYIRVSSDERFMDIIDSQSEIVDRIDLTSGKRIGLPTKKNFSVEDRHSMWKHLPQDRSDHLVLASNLSLVDVATGEVVRRWGQCDEKFIDQRYKPVAAFLDTKGNNWVAAAGMQHLMRVTQLETGVDLAFFPTEGTPVAAQFSKDGKRLFVLSQDSDWLLTYALNIVEMDKRLADSKMYFNSQLPLICSWEEGAS